MGGVARPFRPVSWTDAPRARSVAAALTADRVLAAAIALGVGMRMTFWMTTGRIWEDALITVAHARNAAEGLGLVHHVGEPATHGFTSALSVLIPLAGEVLAGGSGLLVLRAASLVAAVVALVYAKRIARLLALSDEARLFVLLFLAVEQNHIFYGMAGMETQVAVAVLLASLYYGLAGRWLPVGLCLGLGLLARPDFAIFAPIIALAAWRRLGSIDSVKALATSAVVLLPWLAFTVWHYGSFVPNTIRAKSAAYNTLGDSDLVPWLLAQVVSHVAPLIRTFMPFYADSMVLSAPLPPVGAVVVGAVLWVLIGFGLAASIGRSWWRVIAACLVAYTVYRVLFLPTVYFDWYLPPYTAVAAFLVGLGMDRLIRTASVRRVTSIALAIAMLAPFPFIAALEHRIQTEVEDGVRLQVANYLASHVPEGESVVSESAGYIGYYGNVLLYDYPGLTSGRARQTTESLGVDERSPAGLVAAMDPDWVVFRPDEHDELENRWPEVAGMYQRCAGFGPGGSEISSAGLVKVSIDLRFDVYRRGACP